MGTKLKVNEILFADSKVMNKITDYLICVILTAICGLFYDLTTVTDRI
ncbi:hypothetical protein DSUL_80064 [Desulfovibrionales bacterium]